MSQKKQPPMNFGSRPALRVAGIEDISSGLGEIGEVAKGVSSAAQGVSSAVQQGIQQAQESAAEVGHGLAQGAQQAGAGFGAGARGVGSAAQHGEETLGSAVKWGIGLAVGIPVVLGLGALAAFTILGRGAQKTIEAVGPEALRQAPQLLPALMPLLGPEAAMATLAAQSGLGPLAGLGQNVGAYQQLSSPDSLALTRQIGGGLNPSATLVSPGMTRIR